MSIFRSMSARERSRFSIRAALEELLSGERGLAYNITQDCVARAKEQDPSWIQPGELCVSIPLDLLGQRATTQMGTGGGAHLVPEQQLGFAAWLSDHLGLARAGARVVTGVRGIASIPGAELLGDADLLTEVQDISTGSGDVEVVFRDNRAEPCRIGTKSSASRQTLQNSSPELDLLFDQAFARRCSNRLEQQCLLGDGVGTNILGLMVNEDITDVEGADVTGAVLSSMLETVDDQRGATGPMSFLTTRGVIHEGCNTPRFTNGGTPVIQSLGYDSWMFDGCGAYRSQKMPTNLPDPGSPSSLVAHGILAGSFASGCVILLHQEHIDLVVNPYELAGKGAVTFYGWMYASMVTPLPESLARAAVVLSEEE